MIEIISKDTDKIGVYRIMTPSGKIYIGMTTVSFKERWKQHYKDLKVNKHRCLGLQRSFDKYGWDNFTLDIIKSWEKPIDSDELLCLKDSILLEEKLVWIRHKNAGYTLFNGCPSGNGSVMHTIESKEKLSNTLKAMSQEKVNNIFYNQIDYIKECAENPEFTITEIAKLVGLSRKTLAKELRKNNISNKTSMNNNIIKYKEEILDLYFNELLSTREIANVYNVSQPTIINFFNSIRNEDSRFKEIKERGQRKARVMSQESIKKHKNSWENNKYLIACQYCERKITNNNIKRHEKACIT